MYKLVIHSIVGLGLLFSIASFGQASVEAQRFARMNEPNMSSWDKLEDFQEKGFRMGFQDERDRRILEQVERRLSRHRTAILVLQDRVDYLSQRLRMVEDELSYSRNGNYGRRR